MRRGPAFLEQGPGRLQILDFTEQILGGAGHPVHQFAATVPDAVSSQDRDGPAAEDERMEFGDAQPGHEHGRSPSSDPVHQAGPDGILAALGEKGLQIEKRMQPVLVAGEDHLIPIEKAQRQGRRKPRPRIQA